MNRRAFVTTAGAAIASVSLAGCMGDDDVGDSPGDGNETATPGGNGSQNDTRGDFDLGAVEGEVGDVPNGLAVVDHQMVETQNGVAVSGTVENKSDQAFEYVEVEVTLNDGDSIIGEWTDTSEEEMDGLGAGETWRFLAQFDGEDVYQSTTYSIELDGDRA